MKIVWFMLVCWGLCCPVLSGAQEEEEPAVIELQAPDGGAEADLERPPRIGMEAYREVLQSGKYIVGPGDVFLVFAPGMLVPLYNEVLAEGEVFIPKVGNVPVAGLNLAETRQRVQARFAEVVRVGELSFALSQPRQFPVSVLGMVEEPGIHIASGVERVSEAIERAGGLMEEATRRDIRLIKTSHLTPDEREELTRHITLGLAPHGVDERAMRRIDLEMFDITGQSRHNPFLEDGDVVLVWAPSGRIGSFGALKRPGFYDFVEGDKLSDLLRLSLGTSLDWDADNVRLFRFMEDKKTRITQSVDLRSVLAGDPGADIALRADDWLNVGALPDFHQRREVSISGEVRYPGYYVIGPEGMNLRTLVERAGGFTERAALAEARIVRQPQSASTAQIRVSAVDPEFERIRFIPVFERTEDENQYFIMKSRERIGQMSVDWNKLFNEGDERHNIPLLPGDALLVPRLNRTVAVSGAVSQPGTVVYNAAYSVEDYIDRAGGLNWRASDDIRLIKALSGEIKRTKDGVEVQPGDRIWVKERPDRDYWNIFTQAMGVVGQVTTVVLLYATLTGGN